MTSSVTNSDPLGHALTAYLRGDKSATLTVHTNVSEDEPLPASYFFRSLWEMPELERRALEECQGRILDLGAGAGAHALELQNRGFSVRALDVSAGAVQVMEERGVREVAHHNLFDIPASGEQFDTILMLMNGLGLVGTLDGLARFLKHARSFLAPGGQILATSSDVAYLYEDEEGALLIDLNGPYYGEIEYAMTYEGETGAPFQWLFVEASILQDYAEEAGYEMEIVAEDDQQQYLARMTLSAGAHQANQ
ncbi:hypothetical protein GCM10011375_19240 [Hymenobacter qilianensis]|uniref:Uncharacterized protein n=2 Tax=Hymenobacter qilianensis TaxID=1385715 RepID=A0ACB5PRA1_9BACT|nr:class I SAM-dependent methyltransferase [Hymenobacter qilianensis]QNP52100.1 class I SAM-dependent methyltransferase [Hymenobacter qilianensis]GGF64478.1 hypothetical protein GCM10011375_19240 [Hymenobacter qilianensis]